MSTGQFSFSAIVRLNQEDAQRREEQENRYNKEIYEQSYANWLRNAPIRAALRLAPEPEPQPPERVRIKFDEDSFSLKITHGPDTLQRVFPPEPPPLEPVAPGSFSLGPFWPNRTDVRLNGFGKEPNPGDETKDEKGQTWFWYKTPFGPTGYWRLKP